MAQGRGQGRRDDPRGLRTEREKQGLTQEQLARAVGVCVDSIVNWEKGHHQPHIGRWKKYARELGLTLQELQERLGRVAVLLVWWMGGGP